MSDPAGDTWDYAARMPAEWHQWAEYLATSIMVARHSDALKRDRILEDALTNYVCGIFPKDEPIDVEAHAHTPKAEAAAQLRVRCIRCTYEGTVAECKNRLCPNCKSPVRVHLRKLPPRTGAS